MTFDSKIGLVISGITLPSGLWAAWEIEQWPPVIISVTMGTIAFLWTVKNLSDDKWRAALVKRYSDAEVDAERRADAERAKHEERIAEYEAKISAFKDKLDEADDERRTLRHTVRDLQNQVSLAKQVSERTRDKMKAAGDALSEDTPLPSDTPPA